MKDVNGKEIEVGQTLERVVEYKSAKVGHRYEVKQYDFQTGEAGEDLVADGGYAQDLLYPERAKEFKIIESQ